MADTNRPSRPLQQHCQLHTKCRACFDKSTCTRGRAAGSHHFKTFKLSYIVNLAGLVADEDDPSDASLMMHKEFPAQWLKKSYPLLHDQRSSISSRLQVCFIYECITALAWQPAEAAEQDFPGQPVMYTLVCMMAHAGAVPAALSKWTSQARQIVSKSHTLHRIEHLPSSVHSIISCRTPPPEPEDRVLTHPLLGFKDICSSPRPISSHRMPKAQRVSKGGW